ncbi:MBL fold metallo-hydrolase [Paludibacterium sp.]|uniref:MBL fold metallo-hydrolase n=1 Tax=Paludibacterium sp. TaxID=1917523 RepID=UPI0025E39E30|nr:MBL fold metallo-hydrolase [Paludibacterium sp.]
MTNTASPSARIQSDESRAAQSRRLSGPPDGGWWKMLGIMWRFLFNKPADTVPGGPIPLAKLTRAQLDDAADGTLWRLGHSTVLMKLQGAFWLTDPVFAERASPFSWLGPKRFHPAPIALDDLPPLKAVILSHDHYDHLDRAAVTRLAGKTGRFLTPLGVGERLVRWGIDAATVQELDWWQQATIDGVRFAATPAQHFSGRGLRDGNRTLWASWVIMTDTLRVFFSGDSGYFSGFKTIGDRFGPFDLTLMETGAYDVNWPAVHMQPAETLQAHLDLRGQVLLPIHNGTFDLALHAWDAPFEQISALAAARAVPLSTPLMGEAVLIRQAAEHVSRWWREVERVARAASFADKRFSRRCQEDVV